MSTNFQVFINSNFALLVCVYFALSCPSVLCLKVSLGFIVYIIDSVFGYACFIILLTVWNFSSSLNFQGIFLPDRLLFNIYSWSPLTLPCVEAQGAEVKIIFVEPNLKNHKGRQWDLFNV